MRHLSLALLLTPFVLTSMGCLPESYAPMNSTFFAKPPEIHRVGENYRLFVYPASEAPVIVTFARVKSAAEELHVYVTGATSGARPSPWIFDLDIPRRFRGHDLTRRILWLDPDGSVHPLPVNADEQVFAPMETR